MMAKVSFEEVNAVMAEQVSNDQEGDVPDDMPSWKSYILGARSLRDQLNSAPSSEDSNHRAEGRLQS